MPTYETIEYDVEDGAGLVRLDRPDKMNALNDDMFEELISALTHAEDDDEVRAVILTGRDDVFSSGHDLNDAGGESEGRPTVDQWLDRLESVTLGSQTIYNLNVPVIAAVNGLVSTGACDIALVCDLTIASDQARFGYPGIRMSGFPPTLIYPFVMNSIKHTRELLYSGKWIDAEEAERFGMVNRTVPHDELMDDVWAEVDAIKKVPSTTVRLTKHMLNGVMESQGYRPTVKNGQFVNVLAHVSDIGDRFFEIREEEGVNAAIEWMNETDKP